jgi:ubiquinol oxidase
MVNTILLPDAHGLAEEHDAQPVIHHIPGGLSDRFALGVTKLLRFSPADNQAQREHPRAQIGH